MGKGSDKLSLEIGQAYNVVPARASYQGDKLEALQKELDKLGFEYVVKEEN